MSGRRGATGFDAARAARIRARVRTLVERSPEARAVAHGEHLSLEVRQKRFGWFLADHHGDGRVAIHFRTSEAARAELAQEMPDNVHVPRYVGHHGWIGLWLDAPPVKWPLVRRALSDGYLMAAPRTLIANRDGNAAKRRPSETRDAGRHKR